MFQGVVRELRIRAKYPLQVQVFMFSYMPDVPCVPQLLGDSAIVSHRVQASYVRSEIRETFRGILLFVDFL